MKFVAVCLRMECPVSFHASVTRRSTPLDVIDAAELCDELVAFVKE